MIHFDSSNHSLFLPLAISEVRNDSSNSNVCHREVSLILLAELIHKSQAILKELQIHFKHDTGIARQQDDASSAMRGRSTIWKKSRTILPEYL